MASKFNVGTGFSDAEREAPPAIGARDHVSLSGAVERRRAAISELRRRARRRRVAGARAQGRGCARARTRAEPDDKPAADFKVRLVHDEENKFWEIEVRGSTYFTRFGKLGSAGQTRVTDLGSASAARTDADKRAMQKRREGYRNNH